MNTQLSRLQRGLRSFGIHLMNRVSNLLGDDVVGRSARGALLRALGAQIGPGSVFHGGTYFSEPRHLRVGQGCLFNRNCYFDLESTITIGNEVGFGHGTTVITTRHDLGPSHRRGGYTYEGAAVDIGTGVWLGANVTVMPGVSIGRGAVVGTAALVTRDVPPNACVGGVPARELKTLPSTDPPAAP